MDESRLQRIEDKIDRLAELAVNTAVLQNEMFTLQKQLDLESQRGKEQDKDVETLSKRVAALEDRQSLVIKVGVVAILALVGALTGINFL